MCRAKSYPLLSMGAAFTMGATWFFGQRRRERGSLNLWQSVLARRYGAQKAQRLIAAVRQRITELTACPKTRLCAGT